MWKTLADRRPSTLSQNTDEFDELFPIRDGRTGKRMTKEQLEELRERAKQPSFDESLKELRSLSKQLLGQVKRLEKSSRRLEKKIK